MGVGVGPAGRMAVPEGFGPRSHRIGSMNEDAVPDLIRRQWRLPERPARLGRKPTLDVDTVIDAAIELADAAGLEAATLPRISEKLGVTAMSLYRHIGSKEDLLQLMMDAASEPPTTSAPAGWRPGLRHWALEFWELYRRRPWIAHIPLHRAPSGPNQIAWVERGLAPLASTRLTGEQKIRAINLLSGFVRQSHLLAQDLHEGRPAGQAQAQAEHEYGLALARLITADRFPHVAEMLASDVFAESDETTQVTERKDFIDGLELVLDGLEVRIQEAEARAGADADADGDPDTESDTEADGDIDHGSDCDCDSDPDADGNADPDADTDAGGDARTN